MTFNKQSIIKAVSNSVNVVFTFSGVSLIGYGAFLIYKPSAFVVVGLILFWMGIPDKK